MKDKIDPTGIDLKEKVVHIRRVAKVTKGGKRFHFTALVVIGNSDGIVGFGLGKSNQVPDAIRKAIDKAKKRLVKINRKDRTIQHEVLGEHASTKVIIIPAKPGTGVIAGGAVRAVVDLAGIQDILTKVLGSTNPLNVVEAVVNGLSLVMTPDDVAKIRGKDIKELDLPKYYVN
ncbi:30S ribosomal protein S5 [Desulfobacterota bacterium AH_259_B03_O07]|nr:30S ribosomal protein S5 [Desulfobacterota bacterium AH_259_B03_O07]